MEEEEREPQRGIEESDDSGVSESFDELDPEDIDKQQLMDDMAVWGWVYVGASLALAVACFLPWIVGEVSVGSRTMSSSANLLSFTFGYFILILGVGGVTLPLMYHGVKQQMDNLASKAILGLFVVPVVELFLAAKVVVANTGSRSVSRGAVSVSGSASMGMGAYLGAVAILVMILAAYMIASEEDRLGDVMFWTS